MKWKPVDPNYYPNPKDTGKQSVTNREYVHPDMQQAGNKEFFEWKRKCLEQHKTTT